jgi:tetratricopeptide (TPR) repeat protein
VSEDPSQRTDAERLFALALECLERGDPRKALKLARHLELMRFSGAYEIRALVLIEKSESERAITVLRKGVGLAPEAWRLWELLGNLLSDSSRFDEAQAAYERALDSPLCDRPTILYNSAIAHARRGAYDRALEQVSTVAAPDLSINASLLKASLLTSLRRTDEAIAIAHEVVAKLSAPSRVRESTGDDLAAAYSELARAHWEGRCDASEALRTAWKALEHGRRNFLAMRIVREARGLRSPRTCRWRTLVKGRWYEPFEEGTVIPGFFRTYEVLADNPLECFDFVRELEPHQVRDSLEIETIQAIEDCPHEPKGLVAAEPYVFWEKDVGVRPVVTN